MEGVDGEAPHARVLPAQAYLHLACRLRASAWERGDVLDYHHVWLDCCHDHDGEHPNAKSQVLRVVHGRRVRRGLTQHGHETQVVPTATLQEVLLHAFVADVAAQHGRSRKNTPKRLAVLVAHVKKEHVLLPRAACGSQGNELAAHAAHDGDGGDVASGASVSLVVLDEQEGIVEVLRERWDTVTVLDELLQHAAQRLLVGPF